MKRFVLLMLVAASLTPAVAEASAVRFEQELVFRLQRSAKPSSQWDSVRVNRGGSRTDTTVAFSIPGWGPASSAGMALADSVELMTLVFGAVPGSAVTVGSGTTVVTLQTSTDGSNWSNTVNWAAVTVTANNTGGYLYRFTLNGVSSAVLQTTAVPLFRFVINSAATGTQRGFVSYPRQVVPAAWRWAQQR